MADPTAVAGTISSTPVVTDPATALQTAINSAQAFINILQADIADLTLPASQISADRQALIVAQASLSTLVAAQKQNPLGSYTVTQGDTLFLIAQGVLGDATLYKNIMATNGLRGLHIDPGQVLAIPSI